MRVIGIDPGLTRMGYGVVERERGRFVSIEHGVFRTSAGDPLEQRLAALHTTILTFVRRHRPDAAAVERVFFNANVRTAISVGQASGVALAALAEAGVEVAHYTPTEVKQSACGYGGADKRQMGAMVASLLGLESPPQPADAADACALAICHLNRSGLSRRIKEALA
ncbi:MAG TPA: crossover junction endodeoxyribonuclease RuvC [Actinomycetota bacterium]|nr:crossover junction endodeoxyribonuclease RuvC [Actinomycetota bacterium]